MFDQQRGCGADGLAVWRRRVQRGGTGVAAIIGWRHSTLWAGRGQIGGGNGGEAGYSRGRTLISLWRWRNASRSLVRMLGKRRRGRRGGSERPWPGNL